MSEFFPQRTSLFQAITLFTFLIFVELSLLGGVYFYSVRPQLIEASRINGFNTIAKETEKLLQLRKNEEAITNVQKMFEKSTSDKDKAVSYYFLGIAYYNKKDFLKADENLQTAINLGIDNSRPFVLIATIHINNKNWNEAVEYAKKATIFDSNDAEAFNAYAVALWGIGNKKEAVVALEKAISLDPKNEAYKTNLKNLKAE